jgi:hypothetical protein
LRLAAAVAAGLLAWTLAATAANRLLRAMLAGYREAESAMTFSAPMLVARLAVGVIAGVACGWAARAVAGEDGPSAWWAGFVLLVAFVPVHISLWARFPVGYHLFFLASLVVVPPLTARGFRRKPA